MSDDNKPKSAINWPVIESLKVEPLKLKEAIKKIESLPKYKREDNIHSLEEEYPEIEGLFDSP